MESLEELKAIRDGAPNSNYNYMDDDELYWIVTGGNTNNYIFIDGECVETASTPHPLGLRSLSDINRIIELVEFLKSVRDLELEYVTDEMLSEQKHVEGIKALQSAIGDLVGDKHDNSDERINQIARNGGDGEHYEKE